MTMTGLIRLRCACPEAGIARAIACAAVEALSALIRSMHPYHTPAISWWPCARDAATARWVHEATAAQTGDGPAD